MNAVAGKFSVTTLDGGKVLQKAPDETIFQRLRMFIGPVDWSNYTFEADVRVATRRRQMGDIGITAQRYSLVLYGNNQQLKLEPWEPETERTVTVPFSWKPDAWYHVKLRVENLPDGKVRAQGKAWPTGERRAGGMADRQGGSDRQPAGSARRVRGRAVRRVSGQREDRGESIAGATLSSDDNFMTITRHHTLWLTLVLLAAVGQSPRIAASDPGTGDWPMWGGTPDRNMVSNMKGLPTEWDVKTKKNVKWVAQLGSQSYGNPIVADGMVFVGTNNEGLRDPKQGGDRGVLMAFRESDGEFMWQHTHPKLESGRANDWPFQGVASSPLVEGEHLYYVSNRGVVWSLDTKGFRDSENDGPFKDEKLTSQTDPDVIWSFDMIEEVGSYPHNLANSSPVIWGDLIFVSTSNGQDESHVNIPSPKAPAIIALNKTTGKLVWEDNSVENRILHGQWSTPTVGRIGGLVQVISAQGDGWVRGYEATTGKKLWEFDTNPKDSVWPKTRNEVISTPVIYRDRVYIANGQDPEHGEGVGHFYAIDATKRGDITESGRIFHFDKIRRSIATAAIADGLIYIPDFSGFFHCLDAETGREYWVHDLTAAVWGSALVADGKIYLGTEDGDILVMQAGKEKKVLGSFSMGTAVYGTAVPAHNTLFVMNRNQLYALAVK